MKRTSALLLMAALAQGGCTQAPVATPAAAPVAALPTTGDVNQLLVVDCLLPGQVRKLGSQLTYLTPRRAVKTSAIDCEISGGEYVAFDQRNYETALRVWQPQAEQGDARAQNYVGEIYERGLANGPDYAQAAVWYRKAAEQDFAPAQLNLGQFYEAGLGVQRDPDTAASWYQRASGGGKLSLAAPSKDLVKELEDPQAKALRESLGRLEEQLDSAQVALARASKQKAPANADRAAERALLESQLADLRDAAKYLAEERTRLATTQGGNSGDARELEKLSGTLSERERQLAGRAEAADAPDAESLAQDVEWLERAAEEWRAALERHEREQAISVAGPSIQLIDPRLLPSEGPEAAPARGESRIVGRVEAPAGLERLLVNDRETPANEKGIFRSNISVPEAGVQVSIVAIDRQGKRAKRSFELRPGAVASAPSKAKSTPDVRFGRYHALLIGNGNYASLPDLQTSHNDVRALGAVLQQQYGFEVTTLLDASGYQMLAALETMRKNLGADDNVLIYFSGHGALDGPSGYWLPVEALAEQRETWVSNQQLTEILDAMNAKHILVVADSRYSGALTRSSVARLDGDARDADRLAWQRQMASQRSRMLLTSGGDQPVRGGGPNSIFATAFIEVLKANRQVLEADRLASELQALVTYAAETASVEQEPEWAAIKYAGHEGGQFFFVPKS